ncbi:ABC transporter permease [Leucobacter aridicollis]|uniref:NitT/TauT family transport system permease protein n=1 Tax=Leucobacter aridicollis TaxID=283878 RepID=A0A852QVS9_9MICO|nr:ABC transporter permease subunit [Leucobacter aridicollis]MBL3683208.1 ABC transporter permease subunit [Leucobacter aridicollis]NYD25441.1 NitT/TauT family transport system permease protein [Leucobacter aridicollis]
MAQTTLARPLASQNKEFREKPRGPSRQGIQAVYRFIITVLVAILSVVLLWEGYKALGTLTGDKVPFTQIPLPISSSDYAMPHVGVILGALAEPTSGGGGQTLFGYLLTQLSVTLREAGIGLVIGAFIGCVLAVALREVVVLSRGLLPWLVMSQTIPLVALAPIIVVWAGAAGLPSWVAVTIIAAYLSFFPVVINMLTGLNSPDPVQVELMQSVSASRWQILWWLRFPSAVPSLFTGLRLAATASVIGAIVGELSAGTGLGIGRAILTAAYYYSNSPETLFAAVLVASLGGVVFVQIITLVELFVLRKRNVNG